MVSKGFTVYIQDTPGGLMSKVDKIPYLIVVFLIASFLNYSNILPVALTGAAIALYQFFHELEESLDREVKTGCCGKKQRRGGL